MAVNIRACWQSKKIIIVGAGAAGLAAAAELKKMGFHNVTVLEALDRIGGRIRTLKHNCNALELGAEWIHGESENIVYHIAKEHQLIDHLAPDYMSSIYKLPHVRSIEDKTIILNALKFLDEIMDTQHENIISAKCENENILSLAEYLEKNFKNHFSLEENDRTHSLKQAALNWFYKIQCELNGSDSLESVSARLLSQYKECDGCQTVELRHGYISILNILLEQLSTESIILNKVVKIIDWNGVHGDSVKITCEDGSEFFADHLILTLPLGYLKEKAHLLFKPSLPRRKMKAINCTGFGTVNKVYMEFSDPFWKPGDIFNVFWTSDVENICKTSKNFRPWCKDISRFAYVYNQPSMLCAWVTGAGAVAMENMTDEQIISDCHRLLVIVLDDQNIPMPRKIIRSKWNSEPFTRGSYSYLSVSNEAESLGNMDLAEPIFKMSECGEHPLLLFAGEATHPYFYSTVHGAIESGIREAKRISVHYKQKNLSEGK